MKRLLFLLLLPVISLGMRRQELRRAHNKDQHQWLAQAQKETDICGICWGAENLKGLACDARHKFHTDCIEEWRTVQNTCPVCRAEIVDSIWCTCLKSLAKPSVILAVSMATATAGRFLENANAYFQLANPTLENHCVLCASCAITASSALVMGATFYSCIHAKTY